MPNALLKKIRMKMCSIKIGVLVLISTIILNCASIPKTEKETRGKLLINHVSYPEIGEKKVVFQTLTENTPTKFNVVNQEGKTVFKGVFNSGGKVDNWHTGKAFAGLFSSVITPGKYKITTKFNKKIITSETFEIKQYNILEKALPLLLKGLQSAHPEQKIKDWDSKVPFFGTRKDSVDVHGGWYDASADAGKCLSHLGYSNYLTPQQTPLVVYNLLVSAEKYQNRKGADLSLVNDLIKEAMYGGDFLVRMQDDEGYFYTNIFDNWTGDHTKREICAYETLAGTKTENYQAAFREGGGIAIAALARLSTVGSGEFSAKTYLEKAEKGFQHLFLGNVRYCDDGKENIIDDYCALMAVCELYKATKKSKYLDFAQERALHLVYRLSGDVNYTGWFNANEVRVNEERRPYYHAAEAGYPIIALCNYLEIEKNKFLRDKTISVIQRAITFELTITNEVHNPFGYPRQYVKATDEDTKKSTFFMPHQNETGYWYQGENARIASLAAAFNIAKPYMLPEQKQQTQAYVQNQINWILGLNPYDMSMLEGLGRNNPKHINQYNRNYLGGIANGITSGVKDESDIAFLPEEFKSDLAMNWRWTEQWIPHAGWFMLMITTLE